MLLAIDTSTSQASIALYEAGGPVAEMSWQTRRNHTTTLMPAILALLRRIDRSMGELTALAVALGPGSFAGLRVGMSLAKGVALGARLPLVGVPTLDGVALAEIAYPGPVCTMIEAGRGRRAAAIYRHSNGIPERATDYFLGRPAEVADWARAVDENLLFAGDLDAATAAQIMGAWPEARLAPPASRLRRAGYLAELAWGRIERKECDDLERLSPFYVPTASVPGPMGPA